MREDCITIIAMKPEHDSRSAGGCNREQDPERSALDWARRGDRLGHFLETFEARSRRRSRRRWRTAGACLAALFAIGLGWQAALNPAVEPPPTLADAIVAQPAREILPDGSVVELKEGAEFAAEFTDATRRVVLRRGVAHFQVAKNRKPFVVVAGGLEVRAVGTAFSVHLDQEDVEVLVTEGRVAVGKRQAGLDSVERGQATDRIAEQEETSVPHSRSDGGNVGSPAIGSLSSDWLLEAGHLMVIEVTANAIVPQVIPVTDAELAARLRWRLPRLEFNGSPLSEAVATINRYSRVQLRLAGTEAGARAGEVELSGVLRADNIEPLLTMLEGHYGLTIHRAGDIVTLSASEPSER